MSSSARKVPQGLFKTFKVLSLLAKILIFPILILAIFIVGSYSATTSINNVENATILNSSASPVHAGWGYYIAETYSVGEAKFVKVYAKDVTTEIKENDVILYYDIVSPKDEPMEYQVATTTVISSYDSKGLTFYETYDSTHDVEESHIIGQVVNEIPAVIEFGITKLNSLTNFLLFGIVPLVFILSILVIDSVIYIKTRNISSDRGSLTSSRREEDNIRYFEEIKRVYPTEGETQTNTKQIVNDSKETPDIKPYVAPRPMPQDKAKKPRGEFVVERPDVHDNFSAESLVKLAKQNEEEFADVPNKKMPTPPPAPKRQTPPTPPPAPKRQTPPKSPRNLPPKKG
jgi:hypothetical protein